METSLPRTYNFSRRHALKLFGFALLSSQLDAATDKPLRGIFPIMATPYTSSNQVDYEDLEKEVEFMTRCGANGMVWPQLASEYQYLSRAERRRGMQVLAKAIKGKILVCHGGADKFIPEKAIQDFRAGLEAAGVKLDFVAYDGVVHSFTSPDADKANNAGMKYDKNADTDSWKRMKELFQATFGK